MATPESKTKNIVKNILDAYGVYYFMPPGVGYGRAGIPDIICCVNGYFLAIECKAGRGKTTALQERELQNIKTAGGVGIVVYNKSEDYMAVHTVLHALLLRERHT